MKQLDLPILYLIFNRPELVRQTFEQIRSVRPKQLFIAADGPREDHIEDHALCDECRYWVTNQVDWACEVKTLFRDENLGCGVAVSEAISWFFEHVSSGIILEDDIVTGPSFFSFMSKTLRWHQHDSDVMMISGLNINNIWPLHDKSYFFSKFGTGWGWATWKRAWNLYDFHIKAWDNAKTREKILSNFHPSLRAMRTNLYDDLLEGRPDIWDYQWTFARLLNDGISIIPSKNLVKNNGIGPNATHTKSLHQWADFPLNQLDDVKKNTDFIVDQKYDLLHTMPAKARRLGLKQQLVKLFGFG